MLRRLGLALALAFAAASQARAQSDFHNLGRAGAWFVNLTRSNSGMPLCVMGIVDRPRSLFLTYFRDDDKIVVHAFKQGWDIPPDAEVPVAFHVDDAVGWTATALRLDRMADGIEWFVGVSVLSRFEALFRAGAIMTISFPKGSEAPWRVSLGGSNAMMNVFTRCMRAINGDAPQPTQPHAGGAPPSQTFETGPYKQQPTMSVDSKFR